MSGSDGMSDREGACLQCGQRFCIWRLLPWKGTAAFILRPFVRCARQSVLSRLLPAFLNIAACGP